MFRFFALPIILFFSSGSSLFGQESTDASRQETSEVILPEVNPGQLLVRHYSSREYASASQCSRVLQTPNGMVYMTNNSNNLLEFDGVSWQKIQLPTGVNSASLAVTDEGLLYLGGNSKLGFLAPDSIGQMQFQSLLPQLPPADRENFRIHQILINKDQVYFLSDNKIFLLDDNQFQTWESKNRIIKGAFIDGVLYGYREDSGLFSFKDDSFILFPPELRLVDTFVYHIIPVPKGPGQLGESPRMIFLTYPGLYLYDGQKLSLLEGPASRFYQGKFIYRTLAFSENLFGMSTSNGAIIFDAKGNILQELNKNTGLPDNVIYDMEPDREGGLWLATMQGMCRVNSILPALTHFDKNLGLEGVVTFDFERYQNFVYVRTSAGIYGLDPSKGRFELVEGLSGLDWSMFQLEGKLYAIRNELRRIEGNKSFLAKDLDHRVFLSRTSSTFSNTIFLSVYGGTALGINLLKKEGSIWKETLFADLPGLSYMMVEEPDGTLWAAFFGTGIARLQLAQDGTLQNVDIYGEEHGLPGGLIEPILTSKGIVFGGGGRLWDFDKQNQQFKPTAKFEFPDSDRVINPSIWKEDHDGNIWFMDPEGTTSYLKVFRKVPGGNYELDETPYRRLNSSGIYTIIPEADNSIWFGGEDGLYRYNNRNRKQYAIDFDAVVRRVSIIRGGEGRDSLVFGGVKVQDGPIILPFGNNSLRFEFTAFSMEKPEANQYRFFLEGFDEEWSEWTDETKKDYTRLPEGTYTFRVMAKNVYEHLSREGQLIIKILPPWYRSILAYVLYTLGALGFLILVVYAYNKIRLRQLENRNQELEQTVLKKTNELRESNEKLIALDQLKSRFFTDISHEFRTPLTVISGMSEQILDDPDKWSQKGSLMIQRNSNNLLNLVTQILDLRKLEVGKIQLKLIQGNVIPYINYIIESFTSLAESKKIELQFYAGQRELWMDYDPEKILRIVSNLLSNAIKFTPEGGIVSIHASAKTTGASAAFLLTVRDTGTGISPEQLPYIFDRFYQVKSEKDLQAGSESGGAGIGLALSQELIKLMGGKISVESTLGKGTTFTVMIPVSRRAEKSNELELMSEKVTRLASPDLVVANTLDTTIVPEQETAPPTLLIVEDNPDIVQYLAACLQSQFQLDFAVDGQEGIEKAIEQVPDIILSDVMMPRKDGLELCQTLKLDQRTSHIPIVLLTAKADVESRIAGLERGADAYLAKPFNKKELLVSLQKLIELRRRLQQRYSSQEVLEPSTDPALQMEDAFMKKIREAVEQNLDDENFGAPELGKTLGMGRSSLYAKIKALTDRSPALLIRSIRLQKSKELLKTTELNISQVAFEVGFYDPSYFSRCFSQEFGLSPSQFRD